MAGGRRRRGEAGAAGNLEAVIRRAAAHPPSPEALAGLLAPAAGRVDAVRRYVDGARRFVRSVHEETPSGTRAVQVWTRLVDHLVEALYAVLCAENPRRGQGTALVALGGYGRAELSPYSDLDLLVLHGGRRDLAPLVEGLLYPLWDSGVDVQCVARTVEENLEVARADVRSRTSLLESRFLTGDAEVARRFEEVVIRGEIFVRRPQAFIEAKLEEMDARHRRYGDTVYLLQPNVKEGEGGLRDIQTALWVAMIRFQARGVGALLAQGGLPSEEIRGLLEAQDFLLRVRNHLHFLAGRREDRLSYEYQDQAAPFFGFEDAGEIPGVERFLQAFYACANRATLLTRTVLRRAAPPPLARRPPARAVAPGVRLEAGELHLDAAAVDRRPLLLLQAFEAAQAHDAELSPQALAVVRERLDLVDDRFRRDPEAVATFLRILKNPRRVATTLIRMHEAGLLGRFVPEFGRIFCRVQRDLYHIYPVDVHSLFAVQELRRLARGEYEQEFPLLTALIRELERPDILYLAALLHDVGKGAGGRHDEKGAQMALAVGTRMGLEPRDVDYLVFLVQNHLILSLTAQGRDLHDEELIQGFASRVGDPEALKMLYLLTVADIRAVGPGAWTGWKNLLLRELYEKALHVLETGGPPRGLAAERAREVRRQLQEAAAHLPGGELEAFFAGIDDPRYLLAHPVETLVRHLEAFSRRREHPVVELRPVPEEGYTEVLLVTRDRPGLFAHVAGLMAAHRINILSAVLNTRTDDWVVDVFHVGPPRGDPEIPPARWRRWREDLISVLSGRLELDRVVGRKLRRPPGLRRPQPWVGVRVHVDNRASRRFTVVDLQAPDRLGLLYDVSRTFTGQGVSIRLAKIATNIEQVADSFYVERVGGGKIEDPEAIARLEAALRAAVRPGALATEEDR
ncbi:MAG: [protein-PII] uridylyltransferase [Deferrisomatales bacterium]